MCLRSCVCLRDLVVVRSGESDVDILWFGFSRLTDVLPVYVQFFSGYEAGVERGGCQWGMLAGFRHIGRLRVGSGVNLEDADFL